MQKGGPIKGNPPTRTRLVEVLLGMTSLSNPIPLADPITFLDANLNDSQKAAVIFALAAPEVALIHGPPGVSNPFLDLSYTF